MVEGQKQFKKIVVIVNPASTHARLEKRWTRELQQQFPDAKMTILQTSPDGYQANETILKKHAALLGAQTLLAIVGGDGTINTIITSMLTSRDIAAARSTPILPLWGGNANDLAYMLNGFLFRTKLSDIIRRAEIVEIYPLQCEVIYPDGHKVIRIAACYASFGATAFAARRLNEPLHRKSWLLRIPGGRWLQEAKTVLSALIEAPTFTVKENGKVQMAYEQIFANGPRMAKIESFPGRLTDGTFYRTTFEHKHVSAIILRLAELFRGRKLEKVRHNMMNFVTQQTVWAQFDGEVLKVPAESKVTITLSKRPFYALSTTLAKKLK